MGRIDLSATASDSVRRLNPAIFAGKPPETHADGENAAKRDFTRDNAKTPSPRNCGGITKQKKMNKTEARAMEWLRFQGYTGIIAQPTRLFPLAGGGSYTPDFLAWELMSFGIWVIEVKGGYRGPGWEQGYERYRRAALQYSPAGSPWRFALLTWHARRREWTFEAWTSVNPKEIAYIDDWTDRQEAAANAALMERLVLSDEEARGEVLLKHWISEEIKSLLAKARGEENNGKQLS